MKIKNFFHIILLALIIFFLAKVPRYENTLLQLSKNTKIERDYPIFNDDVALFYLESTNLKYIIYVKGLKKLDNIWVGNTYSYKEAYEKNSGFNRNFPFGLGLCFLLFLFKIGIPVFIEVINIS